MISAAKMAIFLNEVGKRKELLVVCGRHAKRYELAPLEAFMGSTGGVCEVSEGVMAIGVERCSNCAHEG